MNFLKKEKVVRGNQVAHVIAEKDILSEADNEWIVKLFFSFQVRNDISVCICHFCTCVFLGHRESLLCYGVHPRW